MILRRITESKGVSSVDLIRQIKAISEEFASLKDETIENFITLYSREMEVDENSINPQDIIDWVIDSGTLGRFVLDFAAELNVSSIQDVALNGDERLLKAIQNTAAKWGITDKDGFDLSLRYDNDESARKKKLPLDGTSGLIYTMFKHVNTTRNPETGGEGAVVPELLETTVEDIRSEYEKLAESLVEKFEFKEADDEEPTEESEEPTSEENPAEENEQPAETSDAPMEEPESLPEENPEPAAFDPLPEEPAMMDMPTEEPSSTMMENAFNTMVNDLVQRYWEIISQINSAKATFEAEYKGENGEDINALLEQLADDATISVGMLHKLAGIVDNKAQVLLDSGAQKAEEILAKK